MIPNSARTSVAALLVVAAACARVDKINAPAVARDAVANRDAVAAVTPMTSNLTSSVPGAVPSPPGLRACFSGDNTPLDVVSNNLGALQGAMSYVPGRFGSAFSFGALGSGVTVPASASLNVGPGAGMTFSAWIFARDTVFQDRTLGFPIIVGAGPIVEFDLGAHMWHHSQQNDPQALFANLAISDAPGDWHIMTAPGTVPYNAWHHTAVTYSKATGHMTLYVDGVMVKDSAMGVFSPNTATTFHIGQRQKPIVGDPTFSFNGAIDEVQLYDRGLTSAEVALLASAAGTMCVPPPAAYTVPQMPSGAAESGVPFAIQPQVAILDAAGNVVSNATTAVTATLTSGTGTLLGTTTVNAVNGYATFTNLAIAGAGTFRIGFTAGTLLPATGSQAVSGPLTVTQVARSLAITTQPGGATSGIPLVQQPLVELRDAAGLRVLGATNVITASVASGSATIAGGGTVSAVNGIATFSNLALSGSGTVTLSFGATGVPAVVSGPVTIQANTVQPGIAGLVLDEMKVSSATVQGSLQLLTGSDDVKFDGNATMTGALYVPGSPSAKLSGKASIGTTVIGPGSASPSDYTVSLTGNSTLGSLVTQINPVAMPVVAAPPKPTGNRKVKLDKSDDQVGDWTTVKDLTISGKAPAVTMPAGTYGDVSVSGGGTLVLGVIGSTTPAVYNFQELSLSGNATLQVVGPVVITVDEDVSLSGQVNATGNAAWLTLRIHDGGLSLSGGTSVNAVVIAPSGKVKLSGGASLTGGLACEELELTGGSLLQVTTAVPMP